MRRTTYALLLFLLLAPLVTGCGSKSKEATPSVPSLPEATTADEWAQRVVDRLLRPTNKDLEVLLTLNNPQSKLFIEQGNPDTLLIVNERMSDLGKCSARLDSIGPPPLDAPHIRQLLHVEDALQRACEHYVDVSKAVLRAVKFMSSGRNDVITEGEKQLRDAAPDARAGAAAYDDAVRTAQRLGEFRRNGLKPPA
jgi:hypothetical protein